MSKRVCLVSYFAWPVLSGVTVPGVSPGGEEVQHSLLAKALAARGASVSILVGDFGQPDEARIQNVNVLKTFRADAGIPGLRMIHPRLTGLWNAMSKANADTYYVSCAGSIVGYVAAFCALHKRRFVFRVASDADCCPERLLVSNARDRWLYEWGLPKASCILAQTKHQQSLLKANYGLDSTLADMLVDIPEEPPGQAARDIDVLWVANLRSVKRPEWVLELAKLLPEIGFLMAGGPYTAQQKLFDSIKQQASALPNLQFLGGVPHRETGDLFGRARLFLNTSELEGFPNTYLQAWANGTPVVATFDPDGLIREKTLGRACTELNGTAEAIRALLSETTARIEVGLRAHRFVKDRHGTLAIRNYEQHLLR
ncbi:glycosyltransferase family 4 protein [Rhodoferax sp.]|uniref:glycosyltransferase family 4 protein n=1 Tax=Rhodoferax sp. TaxID=50421 RepID=UPI00271A1F39|nr:glycosyltransferase family 4 protein [Rhodoferax sp.]MDO9196984.1 glycosyltransferase family 4 protein [Rhodoferax sp.]